MKNIFLGMLLFLLTTGCLMRPYNRLIHSVYIVEEKQKSTDMLDRHHERYIEFFNKHKDHNISFYYTIYSDSSEYVGILVLNCGDVMDYWYMFSTKHLKILLQETDVLLRKKAHDYSWDMYHFTFKKQLQEVNVL